jgi:hypothetical protein
MASGCFSRKVAVDIYSHLLDEFGAIPTKRGQEPYSDFIEGTLDGKKFKFIVYHTQDGELSNIRWQKEASRDDLFQDIKAFFDDVKEDILKQSEKVKAAVLRHQVTKMRVKEEAEATP